MNKFTELDQSEILSVSGGVAFTEAGGVAVGFVGAFIGAGAGIIIVVSSAYFLDRIYSIRSGRSQGAVLSSLVVVLVPFTLVGYDFGKNIGESVGGVVDGLLGR